MAMTRANQKSSIGSLKYHIKSFRFVCGKGSPAPKKIVTTMTLDDESLYEQETNLTPLHMLDENGKSVEMKASDEFIEDEKNIEAASADLTEAEGEAEAGGEFVKVDAGGVAGATDKCADELPQDKPIVYELKVDIKPEPVQGKAGEARLPIHHATSILTFDFTVPSDGAAKAESYYLYSSGEPGGVGPYAKASVSLFDIQNEAAEKWSVLKRKR